MIRHICTLIWNRKRRNLMTSLGLFISFLVLFLVMIMLVNTLQNYLRPTGFVTKDVRFINFDWKDASMNEIRDILIQIRNLAASRPEVQSIAYSRCYIYAPSVSSNGRFEYNDTQEICQIAWGDVDLATTLETTPLRGRWFNESDPIEPVVEPIVINQKMAEDFFGNEDPLGKILKRGDEQFEVIGVLKEFRAGSRFSNSRRQVIRRMILTEKHYTDVAESMGLRLMMKTRADVSAAFEMEMIKQLAAIAPDWSFDVRVLDHLKASASLQSLVFPILLAIISLFMLVNVGLGLYGVVWYQIDRRKAEIGLRRAMGSPVRTIYRQFIGESMMLTTFAIAWGTLFAVQFPLLAVFPEVTAALYLKAYLVSLAIIYLLTFICAWYPSRQATRIQPAEALHYE